LRSRRSRPGVAALTFGDLLLELCEAAIAPLEHRHHHSADRPDHSANAAQKSPLMPLLSF